MIRPFGEPEGFRAGGATSDGLAKSGAGLMFHSGQTRASNAVAGNEWDILLDRKGHVLIKSGCTPCRADISRLRKFR
jgi:hypothetical protein